MLSRLSNRLTAILGVLFFVVVYFLPTLTSWTFATNVVLLVIFAVGFNILLGYGKEISLGHGGLLGFGGYATTLFLIHVDPSLLLAVVFGVVATVVAGAIFGKFSLYSRGIVFAMVTLAIGQIIFFAVYAFRDVLGGGAGIYFPIEVDGTVVGLDLLTTPNLFMIVYVLMILSVLASYRIINSPFGKILIAIGDNEERAHYLGYNTNRHLLVAFTLSAAFAGLAGSLQAVLFVGAAPSVLQVQQSLEVLLATIIGGSGTVGGPVVGMVLFELAKRYLTGITAHWALFFGMMFVLITYFFKGGLYSKYSELLEEYGAE